MHRYSFSKILFSLFFALFLLSACGSTDKKLTLDEIALNSFMDSMQEDGSSPTLETYNSMGIYGISEEDIDEINAVLETFDLEEIDSIEEIEAILGHLGFLDLNPPVITIHGDNPLTLGQYDVYNVDCATAMDEEDGVVTVYVLGEVNSSRVGTYTLRAPLKIHPKNTSFPKKPKTLSQTSYKYLIKSPIQRH
ncbi:MAG: hypothetical protein U9O64_11020 [Campylobacterota bacterium]|nr:hypothetical protein [Campylobacterota bacterium]